MRRFWRLIKWSVLGFGLLLAIAIIALAMYVRTENFAHWAREQAVAAINQSIRGTVTVERLEGSIWGNLILYDVVLRHQDETILELPRVEIGFSLWPLIWGRLQISRVDAERPRARLIESDAGEWNIIEALAPPAPEPETASSLVIWIGALELRNGEVGLRLGHDDGKLYQFRDFNLRGNLRVRPGGLMIDVQRIASLVAARGQPDLRVRGALAYHRSGAAPGVLAIRDFWAVSRNSQVKLNGQITQADPLTIKAQATLPKLAASDIAYFYPEWPFKHDLTGQLMVDGPLESLSGNLELAAVGAKLSGKFRADVAAQTPGYATRLTLSGFDLRRWFDDPNLAGVVDATVEASGKGFTLAALAGKAHVEVRRTQVRGWALGEVSLDGKLQSSVAAIDGRLKSQLGGARWSGKIALQEKPAYDLTLAVKDLDIQRTIPERSPIEGKLNLQATVKGSGLSLRDMSTRADVRILPSTVGPVEVTEGALDLSLSNRRLRIARAALSTAESTLAVAGELGLDATVGGKLDYNLRVRDVAPWLSLVDRAGSGSFQLTGQAHGNLADLSTEGTAQVSGLRLDGTAVRDGSIRYALQGSRERNFPRGLVTARLLGVDAGLAWQRIDATAKLAREPVDSIDLRLNAQDSQQRKHALGGVIELRPDSIVARLREAVVASPAGTWTLARPATVTKRGDRFSIEQLALRSGASVLSADGHFGLAGAQDLALEVDRLPLQTLAAFLPDAVDLAGMIGARGRVTGTAAAPEITAQATLREASIAGQAYAGASADLNYKDKLARLRVVMQQDASHTLTGAGTLPLHLSWHDGWRADFGNNMEFRVQSAGISIAFLNAFAGKSVENIRGEVVLDVLARGPIKRPDLQGTFQLRDGRVKVVPLGVDIVTIAAAGSLDSRRLIVRDIFARAKDGEIRGSGSLALSDLDIRAVKLSLAAKRWPMIETERYQVRVAGNVDVEGSLEAPKLTGKLSVTDGSLRPDLTFLERTKVPLKRDETIVVIKNNRVVLPPAEPGAAKPGVTAKGDFLEAVSVDLIVNAPGNLWIRHPDLVSELSGNIRVRKMPRRELDLTGRIEIVRGWIAFQGRRFQFVRGVIELTGGDKITPSLDIVAQYRVQNYQVQVLISGTSEKPTLTLASEPRLEQADILSLLIFGKPLEALDEREQGALQQSALSITSGFVAATVARSVTRALGLDSLGLDIGDVNFAGGGIGFGRYVAPGTYVSISQQLSGEQGREVSVEYQIAPNWKISSSTTTKGENGIDIIWHKRY